MKMANIFVALLLICVNILAGFIFTEYHWPNVVFSSIVIVSCLIFFLILGTSKLKEAFKVSLSFILPIFGLIEFILAIISPCSLENNGYIMGITMLLVIQIIILTIVRITSKIR